MSYKIERLKELVVNRIFSIKCDPTIMAHAIKEKNDLSPNLIYKFRNLTNNRYGLDNVMENTIWCDSPLNMNDPYDCRFTYISLLDHIVDKKLLKSLLELDVDNLRDNTSIYELFINKKLTLRRLLQVIEMKGFDSSFFLNFFDNEHEQQVNMIVKNYLTKIFFCSFSTRFDSTLMWSHYAKDHSGFCIEYDVGENLDFKNNLFPVFYQKELFKLDREILKNSKEKLSLYISNALLHKSTDWKYENEWRYIQIGQPLNNAKNIKAPKINKIILGSRFFESFKINQEKRDSGYYERKAMALELINHCEKFNVEIDIIKHSSASYSLDRNSISSDECRILLND